MAERSSALKWVRSRPWWHSALMQHQSLEKSLVRGAACLAQPRPHILRSLGTVAARACRNHVGRLRDPALLHRHDVVPCRRRCWAICALAIKFLQDQIGARRRYRIDAPAARDRAAPSPAPEFRTPAVEVACIPVGARTATRATDRLGGVPRMASSAPRKPFRSFLASLADGRARLPSSLISTECADVPAAIEARLVDIEGRQGSRVTALAARLFAHTAARNVAPVLGSDVLGAVCHA